MSGKSKRKGKSKSRLSIVRMCACVGVCGKGASGVRRLSVVASIIINY